MFVKKYTYIILALCTALFFSSCAREQGMDSFAKEDLVSVGFIANSLGAEAITVDKIRIIVFEANTEVCVINSTDGSTSGSVGDNIGRYKVSLKNGKYHFFVIVNEQSNNSVALDGVKTPSDLKAIKIEPDAPFSESNVMLMKKVDIWVKSIDGSEEGEVSTDGINYIGSEFSVPLERVHAKTSLTVKKATLNPSDQFIITKVELCHIPSYSWLEAENYAESAFVNRTLYDNIPGIKFTNNDETHTIVDKISSPSNIFPEYLMTDPSNANMSAYYLITAKYISAIGSTFDVNYKVPLRANLAIDNYNLNRNVNYGVELTITKMGENDAVQINYNIEDWKGESLDVDIEKDPFFDVTNVEANVYDAAVTRVYFYSNQPDVTIKDKLSLGTGGAQLDVKDYFYDIIAEGSNKPRNFVYNFDNTTNLGEGYVDFVNLNTDSRNTVVRIVTLKAGKLERNITLSCIISNEVAKKNETVYVGTFHRNTEVGERIVTWYAKGAWKAEILDPLGDVGKKLRIDRFASPSFHNGNIYSATPVDAEGAIVADNITEVYGYGRVYFRVGWDDYSTPDKQRHTQIKVTYKEVDNGPDLEAILYCRQGEEPDRVVSDAIRFATYNINTPNNFVNYPTLSGYLYQWNRNTPWNITGIVNNYPLDWEETYNPERYTCPPKYELPDKAALLQMEKSLSNATYKWGYYADGYFDRRAVDATQHIVVGPLGDMATAGGLFFLNSSSVGIFMPTAGWRNTGGILEENSLGRFGHYWSSVEDETDPTAKSWALHLTQNRPGNLNMLEKISKNDAMNIRCMRVEGNTISFDAAGGSTQTRSITAKEGVEVTLPPAIKHPYSNYTFIGWAEGTELSDKTYSAGSKIKMFNMDRTLYAKFMIDVYVLEGEGVGDGSISYNDYVIGSNGSKYASLDDAIKGEKAYPMLQLGPQLASVPDWIGAMTTCPVGWRLPRITEIYYLNSQNPDLFHDWNYWSGTEKSDIYVLMLQGKASGQSGVVSEYDKTWNALIRCVKEVKL